MRKKKLLIITLTFFLTILSISIVTALAAANTVPVTHVMDQTNNIAIWELAPPECGAVRVGLEAILICPPDCNSNGNTNDLILGTDGDEIIDGGNGDDCIVGGGGNDQIYGANGNDVLIGGPGSDSLYGEGKKKDTDICIDDPSTTYFDSSCEITSP